MSVGIPIAPDTPAGTTIELVLRSELVAGSRQVLDGPHLRELAESVFSRFTDDLSDRATELSRGESHLGKLVSNVIVARN